MNDLDAVVQRSAEFVHADAVRFMRQPRKSQVNVHLAIYADKSLREPQLSACGLAKYIDRIHIVNTTRTDKTERIRDLFSRFRSGIVIDDHPQVLRRLEGLPGQWIRIRRKVRQRFRATEPTLIGVPVFRDLWTTYSYLVPILKSISKQ